jgi:hypothetical protein
MSSRGVGSSLYYSRKHGQLCSYRASVLGTTNQSVLLFSCSEHSNGVGSTAAGKVRCRQTVGVELCHEMLRGVWGVGARPSI